MKNGGGGVGGGWLAHGPRCFLFLFFFLVSKKNKTFFLNLLLATHVQGNFRIVFLKLEKTKETDKANSMHKCKILKFHCLTAIRSLRAICEESLQDEHEVSTSFFFFSFLTIVYILNAIALNFSSTRKMGGCTSALSCCTVQQVPTVAEIYTLLHIC